MGSGIRASLVLLAGLLFTAAIAIATQYNLLAVALGSFGSVLFALRETFTGAPEPATKGDRPPMKLVWLVFGVALVLITLAPIFGAFSPAPAVASNGSGGSSSGGGGGSSQAPTCPNPCTISIQNSQFGSGAQLQNGNGYVVVKAGTTITWVNKDGTQHTSTSDAAGLWDSGILNSGKSFSHTFNSSGTFTYHCNVHPMVGTVVVVA